MFDFRLKVFFVVAQRLNFTKAAEELYISQPAVSKHIQEIESHYKVKLFDRNGTRIKLTRAGVILLQQVEKLNRIYQDIDTELSALNNIESGQLRIGASTTAAQYYLPKYIASFKKKYPGIKIVLTTGNTEAVEYSLLEDRIDMGIVEGASKRKAIAYTRIVKDEIVLCTRVGNPALKKSSLKIEALHTLPLVLRESGSGSLDVLFAALKKAGSDPGMLSVEMELENSESIKSYLMNSDAYAFLSIHSILRELKENDLQIVDVKGLDIERYFYYIQPVGAPNQIQELFFKHLSH